MRIFLFLLGILLASSALAQNVQNDCPANASSCVAKTALGYATTNLSSRFGVRYDIKADGGAACDGTTDDSAVFTRAITQATAAREIFIPPGAVCIVSADDTLFYTAQYPLVISGAGPSLSTIKIAPGTAWSNLSRQVFRWRAIELDSVPAGGVRDLTIDVNNATSAAADEFFSRQILMCLNCVDWRIDNIRIVNSNPGIAQIYIDGATNPIIQNSYFHQATSTRNGKALQIVDISGTATGLRYINNVSVGSNAYFGGDRHIIVGNDFSASGYGGGFGIFGDYMQIHDNNLHDSNWAIDASGVGPAGIENWGDYNSLTGNKMWNNCSSGISNGGNRAQLIGNVAWNNSRCTFIDAIERGGFMGVKSGSLTGDYAEWKSNTAFDNDAGTQVIGWRALNSSLGVQIFNNNNFVGSSSNYTIDSTTATTVQWLPATRNLYKTGTVVGIPANTTENTMVTYSMPANTQAAVGDTVKIRMGGAFAASTDSKTIRLKYGGSTIGSLTGETASRVSWSMEAEVILTAANAQSYVQMGTVINSSVGGGATSGTMTKTNTSAIDIVVTGQNATNSVLDSVTMQYLFIDVVRNSVPQ